MSYLGVKQIQIAAAVSVAVRHLLHQQQEMFMKNKIIHQLFTYYLTFRFL